MAPTPGSAQLLDAWEAALSEPEPIRAPSLLASLGWLDGPQALGATTIGETDRMLFALRTDLFGTTMECVTACQSCGESLEFDVATTDLVPQSPATPSARAELLDGLLECRPPVNSDFSELLGGSAAFASRRLLWRCLLDDAANLDGLSDEECDRALAELADADPGSSIQLAIECACAHRWIEEFDIRSYLLTELTDWAVRTLRDVHRLASRYGWSETAILRMSPWRKDIYLEACEGA
jgi:hypothetical protein